MVLGSLCAYALSRTDFRGKKDLFFWIISTRMAPVVAVMVPLYAIFRSAGLVGTLPGVLVRVVVERRHRRELHPALVQDRPEPGQDVVETLHDAAVDVVDVLEERPGVAPVDPHVVGLVAVSDGGVLGQCLESRPCGP